MSQVTYGQVPVLALGTENTAPSREQAGPGAERRRRGLPAYCGCCGCLTRYCICSCCCGK